MKHSAQTFWAFQTRSYFSALDGLRALSIVLVLLHHTARGPMNSLFYTLQENGRYGVSLFFLISGFLICTLLLREESVTGRINLRRFYCRRALRLLPLYYAALLLQAILIFGLHQHSPANQVLFQAKLPSYLFYYSNWLPTATQGPFFFAWSLAVEEQFYLLFGLLLPLLPRRWLVALALFALLTKAFVYECFGNVDTRSALWRVLFSYQEPILLGVLLGFALHRQPAYEWFARWFRSPWLPAASGAGAVAWLWFHPMRSQSTWDAQLLYLLMAVTLLGLVLRPSTPLLSAGPLVHVGRISYGMYLFHMFVISSVRKLPGGDSPVFAFFLSTSLLLVLASLIYKYFEYPLISFYKQRFSAIPPATAAAARPLALAGSEPLAPSPRESPGSATVSVASRLASANPSLKTARNSQN